MMMMMMMKHLSLCRFFGRETELEVACQNVQKFCVLGLPKNRAACVTRLPLAETHRSREVQCISYIYYYYYYYCCYCCHSQGLKL